MICSAPQEAPGTRFMEMFQVFLRMFRETCELPVMNVHVEVHAAAEAY